MRASILAMALLCAGCTTDEFVNERLALTDFDRTGPGQFTYTGQANVLQPIDSPGGEDVRMNTLRTWLNQNRMCPRGFTITERHPVKQESFLGIGVYKVHYKGACKA